VSEPVETTKQAIDAWNRADWKTLEGLTWPDAEAKAPEGWPEPEDPSGWAAIQRQFERLKEDLDDDRLEIDEIEQLGGDRVFVHGHWRGKAKGSGIDVDLEIWVIYVLREDKIARIEFFIDEAKAMHAVGR
jgi:ketosteroid isomerase-like protein